MIANTAFLAALTVFLLAASAIEWARFSPALLRPVHSSRVICWSGSLIPWQRQCCTARWKALR